ncbi:MAG: biopolymer transporter ExbD [Magnetococcales bacterium]|nr:biopolymer transporter ExbD [Magnetococcales bacterium]
MAGWMVDPDGGEDRPLAEINVTPLVDVMLVLLVIFIILAPVMANSLKVNLPRASGDATLSQTPLTVVLQADGAMLLNDQPVDSNLLAQRLKEAVQRDPELLVRIDGDGATPYQQVARLLSVVQAQGIRKIAFTTLRP